MSFRKETVFTLNTDNTEVISSELVKTASFSLPDNFTFNPDYLYLKVKAVSAGEWWGCNKNSDFFPEAELKPNYRTFLSAHVFKNHENKAVENAIGDILTADWDDKMKCVVLLIRIDRKVAPTIVRGFERGFMTDVSMGCRIEYSICSICGNKAKTKDQYCDHIKYQRGRVLDDGRKVYEINIAPKFHDISAVLTGAERAAKVVDMRLVNGQNQIMQDENSSMRLLRVASPSDTRIEKAASFSDFSSIPRKQDAPFYSPQIKLASLRDKTAAMNKLSDIQKEIEGNIINSAVKEYKENKEAEIEGYAPIFKILYTKYMNGEDCSRIGDRLRMISDENQISDSTVFSKFLSIADEFGIEFSPLEIYNIYKGIQREYNQITDDPMPKIPMQYLNTNVVDSIENALKRNIPDGITTSRIFSVMPRMERLHDSLLGSANPSAATKVTMIRIIPKSRDNGFSGTGPTDSISDILSELIPERSMMRPILGQRMVRISSDDTQPNFDNIRQFAPVLFADNNNLIKTAEDLSLLEGEYLWEVYQNERVQRAKMEKEASISKQAKHIPSSLSGKAFAYGIPLTLAYGYWQRARINNGKRVNGINRAIAENPLGAAGLQLVLASTLTNEGRDMARGAIKGVKNIPTHFKNAINFVKTADEHEEFLKESGISQKEEGAFKTAMLFIADDKHDKAEDILMEVNANEKDLENYLHLVKNSIKIELDNNDELQKDLALSKFASEQTAECLNDSVDAGIFALISKMQK